MNHLVRRPPPQLAPFVDFFWVSEGYQPRTVRERVLPTGAHSLIVLLDAQKVEIYAEASAHEATLRTGSVVCGARSCPLVIGSVSSPTVGVQFKPGVARHFFGAPAHELGQQTTPLEALWGSAARSLHAQLCELDSAHARMQALEHALWARCAGARAAHSALHASLQAFEQPELDSVAEVNRRTGLSPKRLLTLFRDEVGLSPKTYWRVRRFRAALRDFERGDLKGADLAHAHGYFDQAHWLREFRALTGSSPREYLSHRVAGTDHIALPGQNVQDPGAPGAA